MSALLPHPTYVLIVPGTNQLVLPVGWSHSRGYEEALAAAQAQPGQVVVSTKEFLSKKYSDYIYLEKTFYVREKRYGYKRGVKM